MIILNLYPKKSNLGSKGRLIMKFTGVFLPIVTPFLDDKIDYVSYKNMIEHYVNTGISGIIPLGTTGEVPTLSDYEFQEMIEKTIEFVDGRLPVIAGVGGNYTKKVVDKVKIAEKYPLKGILSVCPYYNKPGQEGIYEHFKTIAGETNLDIIMYNIPYRTGINMENETIHRLARLKNIAGLKDSCGDMKQTLALLMNPPKDFSILTGEDMLYYTTLTLGGQGGILASSHLQTEKFVDIYHKVQKNETLEALAIWKEIYPLIPLLFKEPNPTPTKYCLKKLGLLASDEVRLPLTTISESLKETLDAIF